MAKDAKGSSGIRIIARMARLRILVNSGIKMLMKMVRDWSLYFFVLLRRVWVNRINARIIKPSEYEALIQYQGLELNIVLLVANLESLEKRFVQNRACVTTGSRQRMKIPSLPNHSGWLV